MQGIRARDFFLGVIATCLLLITIRLYDTGFARRAEAQQPENPARLDKPMLVQIVGQAKPMQVEMMRQVGFGQQGYAPVITAEGKLSVEGAIPVLINTQEGPLRSAGGRLKVDTSF